ncbi:hypothetical protein SD960_22985 [Flavobacterium sp. MMLR14_040]|uniref:hypothetical protein n=1 Tax=Flavobacterium sp. MMLR14_040 TaxID=3093843 RepID=UPI00298FBAA1|nr:hypothetical protein [Flavobacterium sp. MMLR14_040]MDW8852984.1 hypothetical protein [Flavobacterium sp. MMLR14_040]
MEMRLRLNYENFFNENDNIQNLIEPLNKLDLLRAVSFITNKSRTEKDSIETINNWFRNPLHKLNLIPRTPANTTILNIFSSLKLLTYIYEKDTQTEVIIDTDEFELRIFKAYLLLNSEQDKIEEAGKNKLPQDGSDEHLSASLLIMTYHNHDLQNYILNEVFLSQFIKAIDFFQFIENDPKLAPHLSLFLSTYKCNTWKEWVTNLLNLIIPVINHNNETYSEIRLEDDHDFEINSNFINLFTVPIDYNESPDFVGLRSNPILKIDEKTFIILSKLFLVERIFKSVVFEFSLKINGSLPKELRIKDFRSIYCDHFSEQVLLYNTLDKCFPGSNKWIKFKGEDFKKNGYSAEPDYYVRFKNKIFLFESKDVILRGEVKQSRDFSILSESLKEKFLKHDIQKKAILQIIENVKRLFNIYYEKIDNKYKVEFLNIFPILVVHDRQFDTPELNRLINIWFKNELRKNFSAKEIFKINDLVIINIDTLILYQEHFRKRGEYGLEIMINKYFEFIRPTIIKSKEEFRQKYLNTSISFSLFVARKFDQTNFKNQPSYIENYIQKLDLK